MGGAQEIINQYQFSKVKGDIQGVIQKVPSYQARKTGDTKSGKRRVIRGIRNRKRQELKLTHKTSCFEQRYLGLSSLVL